MIELQYCRSVRFSGVLVLAILLGMSGCQRSATQRLIGRWEGKPDSTAAYAERQQDALGIRRSAAAANELNESGTSLPVADNSSGEAARQTELENYDVRIVLDLRGDGSVRMWHGDRENELSGTWSVLEAVGPQIRLQIRVVRETADARSIEVRNFQVELAKGEGAFALAEEGADPQFGSLYFRRIAE